MRWKVIELPYFPGQYSLIRRYSGMTTHEQASDYDHLCRYVTLDDAYQTAYLMT